MSHFVKKRCIRKVFKALVFVQSKVILKKMYIPPTIVGECHRGCNIQWVGSGPLAVACDWALIGSFLVYLVPTLRVSLSFWSLQI